MTITAPRPQATRPAAIWVGLGVVYVVWGTTYLAIRVLSLTVAPFVSQGARFVLAGTILAAVVLLRHGRAALRVTREQLGSSMLLGLLFVVCGNGGVAIAEQVVPSALAALLVAAMPLWVVLLRYFLGRDHPRRLTWMGTVLGFAGIAVLARPGADGSVRPWGVDVLLLATVCWATGTFLTRRLTLPVNATVTTVYEMCTGGLTMLVIATTSGQFRGLEVSEVPTRAWVAFAYLTVFGSLVAYSVFVWLLQHAPVSLVTTYAFVNPVVAVSLGWLILDESVTVALLVGGVLAVIGVAMVVRSERREPIEGETA